MIIRKGSPGYIAVHHTVPGSTGAKNLAELKTRASSYNNYHKTKSVGWGCDTPGEFGYKYIRYHWLIAKDGALLQVQDEKYVLYHASDGSTGNFNYHGIGVALDGNYETEIPTDAQKETLAQLIARFEKQYKVNVVVRGHKEVSQTATSCPGKNIGTSSSGWLKTVIARANEILTAKPWYEIVVASVLKVVNDNEAYLYNMDTGEKVKTYAKGTSIGVDYTLGDYYMTAYSVDKKIRNGFKKSEWKLFVEEPEVPPVPQPTELEICQKSLADAIALNGKLVDEIGAKDIEIVGYKDTIEELKKMTLSDASMESLVAEIHKRVS